MDETTAKVVCFLGFTGALLVLCLVHLFVQVPPGPGDKGIKEIVTDIYTAGSWQQMLKAMFANIPAVIFLIYRKSFFGFLATIAVAGFGCMAALFGFGLKEMEFIGCRLIELYKVLFTLLSPGAPFPLEPCPPTHH